MALPTSRAARCRAFAKTGFCSRAKQDADSFVARGCHECARAIYAHALQVSDAASECARADCSLFP
eukprot:5480097-Pleurochrysis_carterae.AAC.1